MLAPLAHLFNELIDELQSVSVHFLVRLSASLSVGTSDRGEMCCMNSVVVEQCS